MPYIIVGLLVIFGVILHDLPQNTMRQSIRHTRISDLPLAQILDASAGRPIGSYRLPRLWIQWFWIIIISLVFMAGLRYRLGMDTFIMEENFRSIPPLSEFSRETIDRFNGGRHALLYSICKSLGLGLWPVQLLCSTFLNIAVGQFICRYTRNWFIAIGFYLCFAFAILNCGVMWQGLAAAFILMGVDAIRRDKIGKFYLFLFFAASAHLSALSLFWLPALRYAKVRRFLYPSPRLILTFVLLSAIAVATRFALLHYGGIADGNFIAEKLRLTSEGIRDYSAEMLAPPPLNYKGIVLYLIPNSILPFAAAILLYRKKKDNDAVPAGASPQRGFSPLELLIIFTVLFALFQLLALRMWVFRRLAYYFLIIACTGCADSFSALRSRRGAACWWISAFAAIAITAAHYFGSATKIGNGRWYEHYIPYSGYIDKGLSHHREWLFYNESRSKHNQPGIEEKDFYFSLEPGSYYIDAPLCDTTGRKDTGAEP